MSADKANSSVYQANADGDYDLIEGIKTLDVAGAENETEYTFSVDSDGVVTVTYSIQGATHTATSTTGPITDAKYSGFMRFEGADGSNVGIKFNFKDMTLASISGLKIQTSPGGKTNLQIGANSIDRALTIEMPDLRSAALGLTYLSIDDVDAACDTLDAIDNALNILTGARGDLGAYQNRLEYTLDALAASEENLTAAESRIRDVDMAAEMVTYTKDSILNQTATAMLAQANQQPNQVLQLLQGL